MKKAKKLTVCTICALSLVAASITMTSCGGDESESKVMTVGVNPQVEFVLDAKDKVVSVNALNEEGNLIISADEFASVEGMSAEAAAKLFVQVSEESGFLVSGSAVSGENVHEFSISISGETAQSLYRSVKGEIEAYCSELDIEATIGQLKQISKEELESLVAECAPYFSQAEVKAMSYSELVQEIADSRAETAEFFSQELKNAYYEAKAVAMQQAEIEVLKSKVGLVTQGIISGLTTAYTTAVDTVEDIRMDMLLAEDSLYQTVLAAFREAKTEYLNYRNYVASLEKSEVTTHISEQLAQLQSVVDAAEEALVSAGETASEALDQAKATLQVAYDSIIDTIEDASVSADSFLTEIDTARSQALTELTVSFESEYGELSVRAEADWAEMRAALVAGYNPGE